MFRSKGATTAIPKVCWCLIIFIFVSPYTVYSQETSFSLLPDNSAKEEKNYQNTRKDQKKSSDIFVQHLSMRTHTHLYYTS